VDEQVRTTDGQVGGSKTFRYLVVPDSAGALALPAVHYPYFDLAAERYGELAVAPTSVPVAARGESAAAVAMPPALVPGERPALAWSAAHAVPDWAWLLLLALPPAALLVRGRLPVRLPRRRKTAATPRNDLRSAEAALDQLVQSLAPDPDRRFGPALVSAVRAAGADAELAARVSAVRERLLARRYGPAADAAHDAALAAEAQEVVRRLGGSLVTPRIRGALLAILVVGMAARASAQNPAPEQLYEAGALRAAAEGFARRAAAEPAVAAHWYNLGAAYYRLGSPGRAEAAWIRARRLDPRQPSVARALALTPPPDAASSRWTWSPPVTPEELLLLGALAWIAGWLGWVVRPRVRDRWLVLIVFGGLAVGGGLTLRAWYRRPLAIVLDPATLRLSPHGRAPALGPVESGSAVRLVGHSPGWVLVRAAGDREGWVPDAAVAAVGG
jgi:hypothetical protein